MAPRNRARQCTLRSMARRRLDWDRNWAPWLPAIGRSIALLEAEALRPLDWDGLPVAPGMAPPDCAPLRLAATGPHSRIPVPTLAPLSPLSRPCPHSRIPVPTVAPAFPLSRPCPASCVPEAILAPPSVTGIRAERADIASPDWCWAGAMPPLCGLPLGLLAVVWQAIMARARGTRGDSPLPGGVAVLSFGAVGLGSVRIAYRTCGATSPPRATRGDRIRACRGGKQSRGLSGVASETACSERAGAPGRHPPRRR